METTENYKLKKPWQDDFYDVDDLNANADILEQELHKAEYPEYEEATKLETIISKENRALSFGKIKKAISSLIAHLSDTVSHITSAERTAWNKNGTDLTAHKSSADHDGRYYTEAEVNALLTNKQNSNTAITTSNIGSQRVSYASNADMVDGHHFNWSGQGGQPSWLWGGNDAANMYVYNPSNFTVANSVRVNDGSHSWSGTDIYTWFADRYTKAEVNNIANGKLFTSGGIISGGLNFSGHDITDVAAIYRSNNDALFLMTNNLVHVGNKSWTGMMDVKCNNLHYQGSLVCDSYRGVKNNIAPATEDEIRKILQIPVETFDYRPGFGNGEKGVVGAIVDEVEKIIPNAVIYPDEWDEDEFNELLGTCGNELVPGIDYNKFIMYLVGMVQLQQKEIEALKQQMKELRGE